VESRNGVVFSTISAFHFVSYGLPAESLNFDGPGSGYWNSHWGGVTNNITGDFNGDEKTDILLI